MTPSQLPVSKPTPLVVVDQTVNADLVEYLERLLDEAKKGELKYMVSALGWAGGSASYAWRVGTKAHIYTLLGALHTCAHDLTSKAAEE